VPQRSADDTVNLAFNGLEPVTRVAFDGRPLDFLLDTGNQTTTHCGRDSPRTFLSWQRVKEGKVALA
jgi:hypothetical protein